jgi:patatin-like phospholipase
MPYIFNPEVFKAEAERIQNRRKALDRDSKPPASPEDTIGLALSGGGIRSATLSLGVIQSLARRELLQKVDYLSTVSGGGYTGCFLGSFFLPPALRQGLEATDEDFEQRCKEAFEELKRASTPQTPSPECGGVRSMLARPADADEPAEADEAHKGGWSAAKAFDWLRNNGRYLAPRGTGDLLYVFAMQVRNWAAVQYVVGVMIMFLLVFFSTFRAWLIRISGEWRAIEVLFLPSPGAAIYWSPGWVFVGAFGLVLLPPALAYWLAHSRVDEKRILSWMPLWHQLTIIGLLLVGLGRAYRVFSNGGPNTLLEDMPRVFWAAVAYILIALSAIATFLVGLAMERKVALTGRPDLKSLRTRFTRWLGSAFWLLLGGAGLALLGTIGQTVYAYLQIEQPGIAGIAGITSVVGAVVAGARQLFKWLGSDSKRTSFRIPLGPLAGAAAVLLLLITGGVWATLVQAALWKGGPPPAVPVAACVKSACGAAPVRLWRHADTVDVALWKRGTDHEVVRLDSTNRGQVPEVDVAISGVAVAPGWMSVLFAGIGFLFLTTGMFLNFINMSSLHQFYAARVGRAYLGATNRERFKDGGVVAVTTPLPTDFIRLEAYYDPRLAAPVHLINVTVNQTRPSDQQLVQRDRKGLGMVIGPGYTVVNAAIFDREDSTGNLLPITGEAGVLAEQGEPPWRRFNSEELDLSDWCAISGAAFSTGLGSRTTLGYSLLAGLANVRLGYWWNFNTERLRSLQLAAYRYLWSELMADFRGPRRPFWFLTDGGHFENTAAYELVRRRVGTIILCDNGCDPDYQFDDLGNLARKIRTDFGAELEPVAEWPAPKDENAGAEDRGTTIVATQPKGDEAGSDRYLGTAEQFADAEQRKDRCLLVYRIIYPDTSRGLLIVLKPNLLSVADVGIDVTQYAKENKPFPQQSTLDQFFDDAQWESYRKLGETMADVALTPAALELGAWRSSVLASSR